MKLIIIIIIIIIIIVIFLVIEHWWNEIDWGSPNISLLFYIFVINHLKTEIMMNYILQPKVVPRSKHSPTRF
jgi:hypothetical protein